MKRGDDLRVRPGRTQPHGPARQAIHCLHLHGPAEKAGGICHGASSSRQNGAAGLRAGPRKGRRRDQEAAVG